jgi:hypothetical protein
MARVLREKRRKVGYVGLSLFSFFFSPLFKRSHPLMHPEIAHKAHIPTFMVRAQWCQAI